MSDAELKVADDLVVSLEYELRFEDGEEIDRSGNGEPLQFLQGHGQIITGLEQALYGMGVGEKRDVVVKPAAAYGEYDSTQLTTVPRDTFPDDLELVEGMNLYLRDRDSDEVVEVFVDEIQPDQVVLDLNHPLAGETLYFSVQVVGLRNATKEELAHGHAHE